MTQHKKNTDKFFEWAAQLPPSTPEEKKQSEEERKALEGTMWEWAQMQPNGDIAVRTSDYGVGGTHGTGGFVVSPDEKDYEKAKQQYGLNKPGDTYSVSKKLVGGNWVILDEEIPEKPNDGNAKSA